MGLVDSLNDAFNKGVSGTERMLEIGKLKTRISTLDKTRTELLTALGAVAYEQYRTSSGSVEAFTALGERIRAVELDMAQAHSRLEELETSAEAATSACPSCAHPNPLAARFCVKCGTPMAEQAPKSACASCGAQLPDGSRFCVRCGAPAQESAGQ